MPTPKSSVPDARHTSSSRGRTATRRRVPLLAGVLAAVGTGLLMPLQSRINGALGTAVGDPLAAACLSFGVGLALLLVLTAATRTGRAGLAAARSAVVRRAFPLWYLAAGAIGAYFVAGQTTAVPLVGIALFTVATVTGQTASGILVDRAGFGPGGRRRVTGLRVLGAALTVVAVVWAVSPRLGDSAAGPPAAWLLPLLLPLTAGVLMGFQQAMNGVQTAHYGTPMTATLVNFATGSLLLLAVYAIKTAVAGPAGPLPGQWWLYIGGALGALFIAVSAVLVRRLGVLLTTLGLIAGQLVGSLALDVLVPAPGTVVAPATVFGTVLTLLAVGIASIPAEARMPWERRR